MKNLLPISILTLALTQLLAGCSDTSPEGRMQKAEKALAAADYKVADIELKNVLLEQPSNAKARLLLGKAQQGRGNWADSEAQLKKALELGAAPEEVLPTLMRTQIKMFKFQEVYDTKIPATGLDSQTIAMMQAERANAAIYLDKPQDAAAAIREGESVLAHTGSPGASPDLEVAKARLAHINKQHDQSMALVDAVLSKQPKFIEALQTKAQILLSYGKPDEAVQVLRQVIAQDPDDIVTQTTIADLELGRNDLAAAEAAIKAAEKVNAGNFRVMFSRAQLELRKGNLKNANEYVQRIQKIAPGHMPTILLGAAVHYGLGNYEQSLKGANLALTQYKGNLFASKLVAASHIRKGDNKSAITAATEIINLYPDDAELLSILGEAHLRDKNYATAMKYLDRASQQQPKNPKIKQSQARALLAMGEIERGLVTLEQAAALNPSASQADSALVLFHLQRKEYDKALTAIAAFEKKLPDNPISQLWRAAVLQGRNDLPAARQALEQALKLDPTFLPAAANLARLDLADKQPEKARLRYETILKHDAKDADAMLALAQMARTAKQDGEYRKWLEKAVAAQPKSLPAQGALTRYYLDKREPQKALIVARAAVNASPDEAEALGLLGGAQVAVGDHASALSTLTQAVEKAPYSAQTYFRLGAALATSQQWHKARTSLEKALALQPAHASAIIKLHQTLTRLGEEKTAEQRLRAWIQAHPDNLVVRSYRAQLLMAAKRNGEAISEYQAILKISPTSALALNNLANLYHQEKDARALQMAEAAYKNAPGEPNILDTLGMLLTEQGQLPRALNLLTEAVRLAPSEPSIRYHYAVALARSGDKVRAKNELDALLRDGKRFPERTQAQKLIATL